MAFVAPSQSNNSHTAVVITYRGNLSRGPVYVVSNANGWTLQPMATVGSDGLQAMLKVPKEMDSIVYKFRVGDYDWEWDDKVPTGKYPYIHYLLYTSLAFTISWCSSGNSPPPFLLPMDTYISTVVPRTSDMLGRYFTIVEYSTYIANGPSQNPTASWA